MNGDQTAGDLAQVNEILESILSNMGDAVIVAGRDEKFLIFNPAAQRIFGEGATDTTSTNWPLRHGLYLPDKVTLFPSDQTPLARAIRGEETNRVEMFVRQAQASSGLWTRVNGRPLRSANGEVIGGVIVCRDITEAKEEEFFRAGQSRVLELIAEDAPLSEILTNLVLLMEGQAEGLRCSVLLLSRDGIHVEHVAAPNIPDVYVKAVDGAPIGPHAGSCGTAMYTRQPVVVTDVLTDPLWADYRGLAKIPGCALAGRPRFSHRRARCSVPSRCIVRNHAARVPKRRDSLESPPTLQESQSSGNARAQSCSRSTRSWRSGWRSERASCAKKTSKWRKS